jgi:hypothetical protein
MTLTENAVPTATGDDDWHVEVRLLDSVEQGDCRKGELLCVLNSASYDVYAGRAVPMMVFEVSLDGVVDFEHDTSKFAFVELALPYTAYEYSGYRRFIGVLTDLRLYPAGVDPLQQSDGDTVAGAGGPDICGYGPDHESHRFAPYLPPERPETQRLLGRAVCVELSLQKNYDEEAQA